MFGLHLTSSIPFSFSLFCFSSHIYVLYPFLFLLFSVWEHSLPGLLESSIQAMKYNRIPSSSSASSECPVHVGTGGIVHIDNDLPITIFAFERRMLRPERVVCNIFFSCFLHSPLLSLLLHPPPPLILALLFLLVLFYFPVFFSYLTISDGVSC